MSFFKKPTNGRFGGEDESFQGIGIQDDPPVKEPAEYDDFVTAPAPQQQPSFGGVNLGGGSLELKVVRPTALSEFPAIADHLLNNRTVVLNLDRATAENTRRMIDLFTGLTYAIDGAIKMVTAKTFIVTPRNVEVSDGSKQEEPKAPEREPEQQREPESIPDYDGNDFIADIDN